MANDHNSLKPRDSNSTPRFKIVLFYGFWYCYFTLFVVAHLYIFGAELVGISLTSTYDLFDYCYFLGDTAKNIAAGFALFGYIHGKPFLNRVVWRILLVIWLGYTAYFVILTSIITPFYTLFDSLLFICFWIPLLLALYRYGFYNQDIWDA